MSIRIGGQIRTRYFVRNKEAGFCANVPITKKMADALTIEGYEEVKANEFYKLEREWENPELLTKGKN